MQKKNVKEPFFHILQPKIQFPEANMQEVFSNKEDLKQNLVIPQSHTLPEHDGKEIEKEKQISIQDSIEVQNAEIKDSEKAMEILEKFEAENRDSQEEKSFTPHLKKMPSPSFKRLKSFKEMDTGERLNYLLNFPKQIPPVPCIFETGESSFRGLLIGKTEDTIKIKLLDGRVKELNIKSIIEIRMVGLGK